MTVGSNQSHRDAHSEWISRPLPARACSAPNRIRTNAAPSATGNRMRHVPRILLGHLTSPILLIPPRIHLYRGMRINHRAILKRRDKPVAVRQPVKHGLRVLIIVRGVWIKMAIVSK